MTTPFVCVCLAFVLIWLARIPVIAAVWRSDEDFDSELPERQAERLEGIGARALAAHRGLLESFAPFAAAVVIAHICHADPRRCAVLAIAFVVAQVVYVAAYLANVDYLRALVWLVGFLTILGLFALAAS